MINYERPVPVLTWDPDSWPGKSHRVVYNAFRNAGSWAEFPPLPDGSGRVAEFSIRKGRQRVTDDFGPGSLHLTLDNTDGLLDPAAPGSPVEGETVGVPVRLAMRWQDTLYPIFTGVVDSSWKPSFTRRGRRAVEVQISDWYGYSARLEDPGNSVALHLGVWGGEPDGELVWWRGPMDASASRVTGSSSANTVLWDFGTGEKNGRNAVRNMLARAPIGNLHLNSFEVGDLDGGAVYGPRDFASSDPNLVKIHFVFENVYTGTSFGSGTYMGCRTAPLGNWHWRVLADAFGIHAVMYSPGGSEIARATTQDNPQLTDEPHQVLVIINRTLRSLSLTTATGTRLASWSGSSASLSGRLWIETNFVKFGEVAVGAIGASSVIDLDGTHTVPLPRNSDAPVTVDMPPFQRRPTRMQQWTGGDAQRVSVFRPQQAFLAAWAAAYGGTVWCRRNGDIRLQSGDDLGLWTAPSNAQLDDGVHEVVAQLTDAPDASDTWTHPTTRRSYTIPVVRYSGEGHTGPDPERIINWIDVPGFKSFDLAGASFVDVASVKRVGARTRSIGGAADVAYEGSPVSEKASDLLDGRAHATDAFSAVRIQPHGDPNATRFVLEDLELEARVMVTQSDPDTAAPLVDEARMRVQAEQWDWSRSGADWTVTLSVDTPVPNR